MRFPVPTLPVNTNLSIADRVRAAPVGPSPMTTWNTSFGTPAAESSEANSNATTAFPTTSGAFQPAVIGHYDGFVTKLNATGTNLVYSTILGGSFDDHGQAIRFFRDSERGPMPRAELAYQQWVGRQRQKAGCRSDAVALNQNRAIVQRPARLED